MKKSYLYGGIAAAVLVGVIAVSQMSNHKTQSGSKSAITAAIVTDVGGIDDKSFNQSAWEGLEAWGKKNNLKQGTNGYNYLQSKSAADYKTNFQTAVSGKYDVIAGVGYALHNATVESAKANPDRKYILIDDVDTSKTKNVVSLMFRSEQSSYLAGVAAATKAKDLGQTSVGFIGGVHGNIVDAFEAGYIAGVKSVDPKITVKSQYADSFTDVAKGQLIAKTMVANGTKIIFQAAGAVGNGVFAEAKSENTTLNADSKDKIWVIGVDMDQSDMGAYTSKDKKASNFTLTSSITGVGNGLKMTIESVQDKKFKGGEIVAYGLKENGVSAPTKNLTKDEKAAVEKAKQEIIDGKITVPNHPEGSKFNQKF